MAALPARPQDLVLFTNEAGRIANQTGNQIIHGGQNIYIENSSALRRTSRCVSVPFTTVSTYTERQTLTRELKHKLWRVHSKTGLAHAVAVIGLGGTGKTQLVLRYIEEHETEYNTVLWLDLRSRETGRASFERCCRALELPCAASTGQEALSSVPAVQTLLHWLRNRSEDQGWLAVADNADDLSWNVGALVPTGCSGSVIITSQDDQASRLLGGKCGTIRVDAMEPHEAEALLLNAVGGELACENAELKALAGQVVHSLDALPLAIDLAGARICADTEGDEDENKVKIAMEQFLADYKRNRDHLLRKYEYARASTYNKTIWTVWETSLASLQSAERVQGGVHPARLLAFLTLLDRANIQTELFRLASLALDDTYAKFGAPATPWLQDLLAIRGDGEWDGFCYRESIGILKRFRLVRSVEGPWSGVTMHGLVQWRASFETMQEDYWQLYMVFIAAVCLGMRMEDAARFRRHALAHLPSNKDLLSRGLGVSSLEAAWMWHELGSAWYEGERWAESEQLYKAAMQTREDELGREHPITLDSMRRLALVYLQQGFYDKAAEQGKQTVEVSRRVLGEHHPDTLTSVGNLVVTYDFQGLHTKAAQLGEQELKISLRALGADHPETLTSMHNLIAIYRHQRHYAAAAKLGLFTVMRRMAVLGKVHPGTLSSMVGLTSVYREQGFYDNAAELGEHVVVISKEVLGETHPDTLENMQNLATSYLGMWDREKHEAAKKLLRQVVAAKEIVLGKVHPNTLISVANLAHALWLLDEAEEAIKFMGHSAELSSRILGDHHCNTVLRMRYLAQWVNEYGRRKGERSIKAPVGSDINNRKLLMSPRSPEKATDDTESDGGVPVDVDTRASGSDSDTHESDNGVFIDI